MEPSSDAVSLREPIANLVNERRLKDAMDLCESARSAFPLDPWLATMQAYLFLTLGESQKASLAATDALSLGSEDPLAVLVLGVAHRNRGRHAAAAEALLTASRLWPDRLDAATMAIEETVIAHGFDAARPVFEEVFARLPDHALEVLWGTLLFDADLHADMPPGVVSAPLMSVPAWLARAGSAPAFAGVRETILLEEPPVFGDPPSDLPKTSLPGYVPYACTLPGATIFAKSSLVLMPDGSALNDTITDERFGRFIDIPYDTAVLRRDDERVLLDVGKYRIEEIEAGVMLSGWASEHFGHWVPEYLARLSYLERHPRFAELPIIVDSDMPDQHLEYLSLLVPNRIVRIPPDGALRCGELVVGSPSTFFPVLLTADHQVPEENQGGVPTHSLRFIQERIERRLPPPAVQDRKLYLSRRSRAWRLLLNEDEISAALAARGFEVLLPEEMTFEEQVRMFQSAKVVVAPSGSSVLNAMFAAKDAKLIVLSQRGLFTWGTFYAPMRELGFDMTFVCSDEETGEKHSNYAIPLATLLAAIEAPAG